MSDIPAAIDPSALLRLPELASALASVQSKLPKLERDRTVEVTQKNGQTYSYSYVTLAKLNDSILPLLAEHGLAFVALPGAGRDGKMSVRYMLLHKSGEILHGEFPISGEGGIQMIGGRITYVRRYVLAALVGVAADEDDESRLADEGSPATASRRPRASADRPATRATREPRPAVGSDEPSVQRSPRTERAPAGSDGEPTPAMLGKMRAELSEMDVHDASDVYDVLGTLVGRKLTSTKQLTKKEAHGLINAMVKANEQHSSAAAALGALTDLYKGPEPGQRPPGNARDSGKAGSAKAAPAAQAPEDRAAVRRQSIVGKPDPDARAPWDPDDSLFPPNDDPGGAR